MSSSQPNWKRSEVRFLEPKINIYYKWKIFGTIGQTLTSVGGTTLVDRFRNGCFGRVFLWRGGNSASRALHVLFSYEIDSPNPDELWFSIQDRQFRFCPKHYALVTGLSFGFSNFNPSQGPHDPFGIGVYMRVAGGRPIVLKVLLRKFTSVSLYGNTRMSIDDNERHDDYLKVANILALYFFFLGFAESRKVENWVWILVDDLSAWDRFPWGAYTYGALMHYVGIVPMTKTDSLPSYHLYGPMWAVQVWAYETMPLLGEATASYVDPNIIPRVMRWKFGTPPEIDFARIFGHEFIYRELIVSAVEAEQDYWKSTRCGKLFGVRFLMVDNPMHPRLVREGKPILFRVAKEIRKNTSRGQRIKKSSLVDEEKHDDEPLQQPQTQTRGKRKDASRGTSSSLCDGDDESNMIPEGLYETLKTDLINHIEVVLVPRIIKKVIDQIDSNVIPKWRKEFPNDMKARMESFFGSKRYSKGKFKSRGHGETSSDYRKIYVRHSVSVHNDPLNQLANREASRHSWSGQHQTQSQAQAQPQSHPQHQLLIEPQHRGQRVLHCYESSRKSKRGPAT